MKNRLKLFLALFIGCLICVPSAFSEDSSGSKDEQKAEVKVEESVQTETIVEAYANNFETLCFIYRRPGACPSCDRVKPDLARLEDDGYPVTLVYCDDPKTRDILEYWEIEKVPTFVTVRRERSGEAEEHSRFTSSIGVYNKISFMYRERLDFDPRKPHKPRPAILPPPRPKPRPSDPKPFPRPKPNPIEPKPRPGDPKPFPLPKPKPRWYDAPYLPWNWD